MFPYFPIRFLMFHQLLPQSLWVFPVFSLVFLPVSCFRSYKNVNHCERSKDGKNSKKTKQTTANSVRTITMIFLKRVSTIQLFNLQKYPVGLLEKVRLLYIYIYIYIYALVIARFRVQYGQYFRSFSYFADLFHNPLSKI